MVLRRREETLSQRIRRSIRAKLRPSVFHVSTLSTDMHNYVKCIMCKNSIPVTRREEKNRTICNMIFRKWGEGGGVKDHLELFQKFIHSGGERFLLFGPKSKFDHCRRVRSVPTAWWLRLVSRTFYILTIGSFFYQAFKAPFPPKSSRICLNFAQ